MKPEDAKKRKGGGPPVIVFTKPWQNLAIGELADLISELGFAGVELPVRPGYQVEPDQVGELLGKAVEAFEDRGLMIYSVAGEIDRATALACARAGVPVLRTMLKLDPEKSYRENVDAFRSRCREIGEVLKDSPTTIGLQNHCDDFVSSALGLIHAIDPLPDDQVSAVLDLGHTGLDGEGEEIAIDIAWPRLSLVNLKNSLRRVEGRDERGAAIWKRAWVSGREGFTNWEKAIKELSRRNYRQPICLTAEYQDESGRVVVAGKIIPYLKDDLEFLQQLIEIASRKEGEGTTKGTKNAKGAGAPIRNFKRC